jgi:hypothetical protein
MGSYLSRGLLAALVVACGGASVIPEVAAQESVPDYRRPGYGARGVGVSDWVFVPPMLSVYNRPRPDYDAAGLRLGSFLFYPELGLEGGYDSNVFAETHNTKGDFFGATTPAFRLQSDWSTHLLGVEGAATLTGFTDETSQNSVQGRASVFGRLDITGDDALYASAGYHRVVLPPGTDPDEEVADSQTEFNLWTGRLGYTHQFARMNLRVDTQGQRYDYLDQQDEDRDRDEFDVGTRLTYALSPRFTPFVQIGYSLANYDDAVDDTGVDRDQQSYVAQVGGRVLITELLLAELSGGVSYTNFDDDSLNSLVAPAVNGQLTWNITELTSIIGQASMRQVPTTQGGSTSRIQSGAGVRVEHELLSNLLVFGEVQYRNENYQDSDRDDNRYLAGLGGEYLLNNYVSFTARYGFEHRESNVAQDFTRNVVLVGVRLQY